MMSKGKMRSVPASSPETLNVIPIAISACSAACCRRSSSPSGSWLEKLDEELGAPDVGGSGGSNSSS